jgi:hypothetical protein
MVRGPQELMKLAFEPLSIVRGRPIDGEETRLLG